MSVSGDCPMPNAIKELPFPWPCGKCGEQAVERATLPYSTVVQYDGRSDTVEVPEFQVPRCKNCGALVFDDPANDQIADALRQQVGLLSPERIRGNRESLGLTQRDFANLLGVGESTVSRWETGSQIQQRSLDCLMRLFFAFPEVRDALIGRDRLADLGTQVVEKPEPRPVEPGRPYAPDFFDEVMRRYLETANREGQETTDEAARSNSPAPSFWASVFRRLSETQADPRPFSESFVETLTQASHRSSPGTCPRRRWFVATTPRRQKERPGAGRSTFRACVSARCLDGRQARVDPRRIPEIGGNHDGLDAGNVPDESRMSTASPSWTEGNLARHHGQRSPREPRLLRGTCWGSPAGR